MSSAATNAAIVFAKTFVLIKIFQLRNWAKTSLKPSSMFDSFGISIIQLYNQFLAVLLPFNKKVKRHELLRFTSKENTEENAFWLLCSKTDQKAQF